ncbi:MAG: class I SAM-dependent methyltransferase, partial [Chloroflexi bacterium]|nr:class I SAM-dependent methyltransferase [Chloroflexota bacterium]
MQVGRQKLRTRRAEQIALAAGDALRLPFADETFDGVVNGFLLRNVVDLPRTLAEMRRVTKRGGRVVSLEISHPPLPIFRQCFQLYFYRIVPLIGGVVAGDIQAYSYLPNSLTAFPAAEPLRRLMLDADFRDVRFRRLSLGTMALHVAEV